MWAKQRPDRADYSCVQCLDVQVSSYPNSSIVVLQCSRQAVTRFGIIILEDFVAVAVYEAYKTVPNIDITMPCENRYNAFQAARHKKQ
jgi:hypothetical protein